MRRPLGYLVLFALCACSRPPAPVPKSSSSHEGQLAHREQLRKDIITAAPGVHVAIGYGLANTIWLEGPDGVVVVDTLGSLKAARAAKAALRKITDKPIRAIVLTHNHADHTFGTQAMLEGEAPDVPIYAHHNMNAALDRVVSVIRPIIYTRSMRMFGTQLGGDDLMHCGIGAYLETDLTDAGLRRPTHTFEQRLELTIAGLRIVLQHAPGETDDQLHLWLPDAQVLLPADNFYRAFPNLYTIRGTPYRDVRSWVRSLDAMRALKPKVLVPSHTRPIEGTEAVYTALTDYRDAIQYVHDQTVRGMNLGLTPDVLVAQVRLPPHLSQSPYLAEHYGTVAWSVRSIFDGYLGWFDGVGAHLEPLSAQARAQRWARALPKGSSLAGMAEQALQSEDHQWAAELAQLALATAPDDRAAQTTLSQALRALGEAHPSANGRNYYLTAAAEASGRVHIDRPRMDQLHPSFLQRLPLERFLASMPVHLNPKASRDVQLCAGFIFTQPDARYTIEIRRGVAIVQEQGGCKPAFTLHCSAETYKALVVNKTGPAQALAEGALKIDGSMVDLVAFFRLFEQP